MRFWGTVRIDTRIIKQSIVETDAKKENASDALLEESINEICRELDLARPIILKKHIFELKSFGRTVFKQQDFIEPLNFDQLEIEVFAK